MVRYILQCISGKKITSYAQYWQDVFVATVFFNTKKKGFFMDIGAYDGVKFSNSYFFERHLKWNGIAVEPNNSIFGKLQQNRHCHLVNGVISNQTGTVEYMRVAGDGEMLSGIVHNFADKHVDRIEKTIEKSGGELFIEQKQSYDVSSLLQMFQVQQLSFVSIDTEGSEMDILKSFPFQQLKPEVILVENNYRSSELKAFLEGQGYHFCFRFGDDIYYHQPISWQIKYKIAVFRLLRKCNFFNQAFA